MRLANKKFAETYTNYQGDVFRTNTPSYISEAGTMVFDVSEYTSVTTNQVDGLWIFQFYHPVGGLQVVGNARVELASDGSTNLVTVKIQRGMQ
jgi:hypothetical protein